MKRTNNSSYLVVIDGMENTGVKYLANWIYSRNQDNFILCCPEDDSMLSVQDTYELIVKLHNDYPDKYIVTSNLWISNTVYSILNDKETLNKTLFKANFEDLFNGRIVNIVLLWDSFLDYCTKLNLNEVYEQPSMEIFEQQKELFEIVGYENNAKFIDMKSNTLVEDLYNRFSYIMSSIF